MGTPRFESPVPTRFPRLARRVSSALGLVGCLTILVAASTIAQEPGVVAGTVVASQSLRPLSDAQVHVVGTDIGTLTDEQGRFRLTGLTGEEVTIQVRLIGYRSLERSVPVGTTDLRLPLVESAIRLDEIVVTGTPGETRRRAIGNSVSEIDVSAAAELAPSQDLQTLVSGRVPGVTVLTGQGNLGTGGVTRVRGISSLSLSNEPIVYIDGVRVNSDANAGPSIRGGRQVSRLSDLNPEDIASIEVIKGPAAATLYGTEASNGVIQIITKKGSGGAPVVELSVEQGANFLNNKSRFPVNYWQNPETGQVESQDLLAQEETAGRPIFQTGHAQKYSGAVRGGLDALRYYASGQYDDAEGVVDYNWRKRYSGRLNLDIPVRDNFQINTNFGYVRNDTRLGQAANGWDLMAQIHWGTPRQKDGPTRGFLRAPPEAVATIESKAEIDRATIGAQMDFRPREWFFHRLNVGVDVGDETNSILFPRHPEGDAYFFGGQSLGDRSLERRRTTFLTFDYATTASLDATPDLNLATSFGVQYYSKRFETSAAQGRVFPAPSVTSVGGAAVTFGDEDLIENKTLGLYVQERIGWKNRVFITAALRGDDNSAFGTNFNFVTYPKVSATWVVDEEPFFDVSWVNTLRLRGAWGRAGQQPDVFAAARLYGPTTGPGDVSTLTPQNVGNPDLKPEVGEEIELGFDAALQDERVGLEFTWFHKTTSDAIVERGVAPSLGFPGTQFVNLGEVKNWGVELGLRGRALDGERVALDLSATLATNDSEVTDLGDLPPVSTGTLQQHREGYPVGGIFIRRVVDVTLDGDGNVVEALCAGDEETPEPLPCASAPRVFVGVPTPKWQATFSGTLTFLENFRLFGLVDAMGGHHLLNGDIGASHVLLINSRAAAERDPTVQGYATFNGWQNSGLMDAGFAKLREVSLAYSLPERLLSRVGIDRASIAVAGRNLAVLWRATDDVFGRKVIDPEVRLTSNEQSAYFQTVMPQYASFSTTLRLSF